MGKTLLLLGIGLSLCLTTLSVPAAGVLKPAVDFPLSVDSYRVPRRVAPADPIAFFGGPLAIAWFSERTSTILSWEAPSFSSCTESIPFPIRITLTDGFHIYLDVVGEIINRGFDRGGQPQLRSHSISR